MNLTGSVSSNLTFSLLNERLKDEKYYGLPMLINVNSIKNGNYYLMLAPYKSNVQILGLEQ